MADESRLLERETTRQARIARILDYMFRAESEGGLAMGDQGEFWTCESIAQDSDEFTVMGNWNDPTVYHELHGPLQQFENKRWVVSRVRQVEFDGRWNDVHLAGGSEGYFVTEPALKYLGPGWRETIDETPSRLEKVLEALGVNVVWSDEYLLCDCGKAFRVSPDGYNWVMHGYIGDGDYMCGDCLADTECEECGNPDINSGHCHQAPENIDTCHCGHECDQDETEEAPE